jgi:hypothetical protein
MKESALNPNFSAFPYESVDFPKAPRTVDAAGISREAMLELMIKTIHISGLETISQISSYMKVMRSVVHELLEDARSLTLVEVRGSVDGGMSSEMRYGLTSKGHSKADDALNKSQYVGPAPVPFDEFCAQVARQDILNERVKWGRLSKCFDHLVLPEDLLHRLGPAVNSGKSLLLFGPPGNGKTCIAEAVGQAFQQTIYFPYAIDVDGQTIKFFDEMVHKQVDLPAADPGDREYHSTPDSGGLDPRWVPCQRPVVSTGGELTLGMLDLTFNPHAKFYEAPLQLKAVGGVFLVDDFGRQQTQPQDILNRWIVPLERGIDYLTLHTGKKFSVPFNELVVFSTNIVPSELCDEATLRRLYYKIEVPIPTKEDYSEIFSDVCSAQGIAFDPELLEFLFREFYAAKGLPLAGYHPTYLVDQIKAMCEYHDIPVQINNDLLRLAWNNLYAV